MVDVKSLAKYAQEMSVLIVEDNKKLRDKLDTFLSKIFFILNNNPHFINKILCSSVSFSGVQ